MDDSLMAVTLWPEHAFAVAHLNKRVENRSFALHSRYAWLAIHSGAYIGGRRARWARAKGLRGLIADAKRRGYVVEETTTDYADHSAGVTIDGGDELAIVTSAIVAVARFCSSNAPPHSELPPWGLPGKHHWIMETVRTFEPIGGVGGSRGLWPCDRHVFEQIRERCPTW